MTKKKLKRLILLLQSSYMFQSYVIRDKAGRKLLQANECMDIRVRKWKEKFWDSCVEFLFKCDTV